VTTIADRLYRAAQSASSNAGLERDVARLLARVGLLGLMSRLKPDLTVDPAWLRLQKLSHTLLREGAIEISGALGAAGIDHFFAKGIGLLGEVYQVGDRVISDLDLHIRPAQCRSAVDLLRTLEFAPLADDHQVGPEALRSTLALERPAPSQVQQVTVDLHWGLDPVDRLLPRGDQPVPERVWAAIRTDRDLPVPSPEHHAALLAHHLVHTDLLHLRSLMDAAFVLETFAQDGEEYLTTCRELGIARFGMALAEVIAREFDIALPAALERRSKGGSSFGRTLTLESWLTLVAQSPPDQDEAITVPRIRRRIAMVGQRATVRLLADVFFPPRAFLEWRWSDASAAGARRAHYRQLMRKVLRR